MSDTVLEKKCEDNERPFSQKELEYLRHRTYKRLYLGKVLIEHPECGHFYYAKSNGKKEKEAIETNNNNVGNCSVCWKLTRTPKRLKDKAYNLVNEYCSVMYRKPNFYTHTLYELEKDFYTWLYTEFNPVKENS